MERVELLRCGLNNEAKERIVKFLMLSVVLCGVETLMIRKKKYKIIRKHQKHLKCVSGEEWRKSGLKRTHHKQESIEKRRREK